MRIANKSILNIIICVSVFSFFVGCSKIDDSINQLSTQKSEKVPITTLAGTNNEKSVNTSENDGTKKAPVTLESWVGNYIFSEYAPPDQNMFYTISIYKENNEYYSKINIDGFQTIVRLQAKVSGDEKTIELLFASYLPDNQFEPYDEGDILLSLEKRDSDIYTLWGKIQPMIESNKKSGKVYFKIEQK